MTICFHIQVCDHSTYFASCDVECDVLGDETPVEETIEASHAEVQGDRGVQLFSPEPPGTAIVPLTAAPLPASRACPATGHTRRYGTA